MADRSDLERQMQIFTGGDTPEFGDTILRDSERWRFAGFRYNVEGWYQNNVPASQTNQVMFRYNGPVADPYIAPRDGLALSVYVKSNEARTAGTLTATVFKAGVATTLTAVLDATNTTFKATKITGELVSFDAGDELDIRITTSAAWAPTTADIRAGFEVEA